MVNNYNTTVQSSNRALQAILEGIENLPTAQVITSRTYEITLAKSAGWVLLTTLDDDVLAHINDPTFSATLSPLEEYSLVDYSSKAFLVHNVAIGMQNAYPIYGFSMRQNNSTSNSMFPMYYPANKTDTITSLGGFQVRCEGRKYYFRPGDGFVAPGTYRLTFQW